MVNFSRTKVKSCCKSFPQELITLSVLNNKKEFGITNGTPAIHNVIVQIQLHTWTTKHQIQYNDWHYIILWEAIYWWILLKSYVISLGWLWGGIRVWDRLNTDIRLSSKSLSSEGSNISVISIFFPLEFPQVLSKPLLVYFTHHLTHHNSQQHHHILITS